MRELAITLLVTSMVILMGSTIQAQTAWTKYPENPVMDVGSAGSWDDNYLLESTVILDDTTYKMWYAASDGDRFRIGYATSTNKVNWTKYVGNPVLDEDPIGSCGVDGVDNPSVMFDEGIYKMWYQALEGSIRRICYATSDDGIIWTKVDSVNPVLDVGSAGSWDDSKVQVPVVVRIDTLYYMWYAGRGTNSKIGLATSSDGVVWDKEGTNPVMDVGTGWEGAGVFPESVIYDGSVFQMWYLGLNSSFVGETGYATSPDGIIWTKDTLNPVLKIGPVGDWDHSSAIADAVLYDGTNYHMWYENTILTNFGAFGCASTDSTIIDNIAPNPPTNVNAEDNSSIAGFPEIKIRWDESSEPDFSQYLLYRTTTSGVYADSFSLIDESPVNGIVTYNDSTNLIRGVAYYYVVTATDVNGNESEFSEEVSATPVVIGVEDEHSIPAEYTLSKNFPNPFNPRTTIKYAIPKSGEVSLIVYNLLGEEVTRLISENHQAGYHQVTWDASNMASGVYFYRLQAGDFVQTRKMVLLK